MKWNFLFSKLKGEWDRNCIKPLWGKFYVSSKHFWWIIKNQRSAFFHQPRVFVINYRIAPAFFHFVFYYWSRFLLLKNGKIKVIRWKFILLNAKWSGPSMLSIFSGHVEFSGYFINDDTVYHPWCRERLWQNIQLLNSSTQQTANCNFQNSRKNTKNCTTFGRQ